jgi:hypothetical protein
VPLIAERLVREVDNETQGPQAINEDYQLRRRIRQRNRLRALSPWCLALALGVLLPGCTLTAKDREVESALPPVVELSGTAGLPAASWVDRSFWIFDQVTRAAGLTPLREETLEPGDREVRVWIVHGLSYPDDLYRILDAEGVASGELIRYWPVFDLPEGEPGKTSQDVTLHHQAGRCAEFRIVDDIGTCRALFIRSPDWASLLERAEDDGLWTLPDPSSLPPTTYFQLDGWSMTVELRDGASYRAYHYVFPMATRVWPEGEAAGRIAMDFRNTVGRLVRPPDSVREYRGVTSGVYGSGFVACHGVDEWQFRGVIARLAEAANLLLPASGPGESYYVEVRGQLYPEWMTREWKTGFSQVLHPTELLKVRSWTGGECNEETVDGT